MEGKKTQSGVKVKVGSAPIASTLKARHSLNDESHLKAKSEKTVGDYMLPVMDDPGLNKVIDDMIVSESNEVLAAEDSMLTSRVETKSRKGKRPSLKKVLKNKWLYISLGLVIIALMGVPYSRYLILGHFLTNQYPITILDSVTSQPVSGALITADGHKVSTNAYGQASLKLPLGQASFKVTKGYYSTLDGHIFVGIKKPAGETIYLIATGRQVSITVRSELTSRPLSGVHIAILNTSDVTNSSGQTQIVLPTKQYHYDATFSAAGFNDLTIPISVTTSKTANIIKLVPAGSIYYLSDSTGTVDVIKANLDGSNPTIELAGTGSETSSTVLMPSPDWKYLVLEVQRSTAQPELYVINTSTGNLDEFDSAADNFKLIGWSGDQFIYDEVAGSNTAATGNEQIKSYNATNSTLNVLDQNQVAGSSPSYAYQSFGSFQLLPDQLLYTTSWTSVGSYDLSSENDTIRGVEPNGLNKKDYTSYTASTTGQISVVRNSPTSFYFSVPNTSTSQTSYYQFTGDSILNTTSSNFTATYPDYFLSPSGEETLWQNTNVYSGNQTGGNAKKISLPAGYHLIGWYDNVYMLLGRGSQLYIAPATGTNSPHLVGTTMNPNTP